MNPGSDRLLTFEVANAVFALPIEAVLEVAEADVATCVPGIPGDVARVMNWNGDPLPVVASRLLLAGDDDAQISDRVPAPTADEGETSILREQVLVVSDRADEAARLGMPVDRVIGLVDGRAKPGRLPGVVIERRPVDGRVVGLLDPHRLVARAEEIIEGSVV
jgi:chemotaxis signal transduction protein